ncbi:putative gegh 16 protein [Mycena indigotica]|uniref:Putative gegh 16 protein n=1 Tax=Mycena indigotica TaxID=2126181 RepID=A0A8H6TEP2_9AGAR|nr:putative gegh 16 protein [Mycena indigotica]KAF7315874.1 putative gegh 16 protein [Mycena indigotica]
MKTSNTVTLLLAATSAYGHAVVTQVFGSNGVITSGLGVVKGTPRTGTDPQPFQIDTPVLKNMKDDPCGATLGGGSINIPTAINAAIAEGGGSLPSLAANGSISLEIHQVNADGGGPFTAMVNADATGKTWVPATVLIQAPGTNGILHGGPANVPFAIQIPTGTKCTGGQDGATCLIRLNNGGKGNTLSLAQGAGPFGGCIAVTQDPAAGPQVKGPQKAGAKPKGPRVFSRFFDPSIVARDAVVEDHLRARVVDDLTYLAARGELTVDLIDEIKTATGTAIDIPIDMLAGQNDAADLGGNSTTAPNAVLTVQQAVDLKKAVTDAIETALTILSSGGDVVAQNAQPLDQTNAANAAAADALLDGTLTAVNKGNAGVGKPQTAVVDSLLGPLATLTRATNFAKSTATVAGDPALLAPGADSAAPVGAVASAPVAIASASPIGRPGRKGKGRKFGKSRLNN